MAETLTVASEEWALRAVADGKEVGIVADPESAEAARVFGVAALAVSDPAVADLSLLDGGEAIIVVHDGGEQWARAVREGLAALGVPARTLRPTAGPTLAGHLAAGGAVDELESFQMAEAPPVGLVGRPYADAAWAYVKAGWQGVIPLGNRPTEKSPPPKGYTGYAGVDPSGADVQAWIDGPEGARNVGLHLPIGVYVLDVDAHSGKPAVESLAALEAQCGPLPDTWTSTSRGVDASSRHRFYRAVLPEDRIWIDHPGPLPGLDSLHTGHRYAVVWPSVHDETGETYWWYDDTGEPYEGIPEVEWLAELPPEWIDALSKPGHALEGSAASDADTLAAIRSFRDDQNGEPCRRVALVLDAELKRIAGAKSGTTLHDPGKLHHLAMLGFEGHRGVGKALQRHEAAYVGACLTFRDNRSADGASGEWWRMVRGTIGKNTKPLASVCECDEPFAGIVPDGGEATTALVPGTPAEPGAIGVDDFDGAPISGLSGRVLRRSDLAKLPPVEPLIDGVMSRRATVVLIGASGGGKTFLGLSWACSVATGHNWLGRSVHRTKVLYVVGEGEYGLGKRVTAWEEAWKTPVSDEDLVFVVRPASLTNPGTWAWLSAYARWLGAGLIVLDTFSSLASDADETRDAALMVRRMAELSGATDATVLLVHHTGWSDLGRARGGSQFEANPDEALILHGTRTSPLIELEYKKRKDAPSGDREWLRRLPFAGSVVIQTATPQEAVATDAGGAGAVVRELFAGDTVSGAQVRDALVERLGMKRSTAYISIKELIAAGMLTRNGGTDNRPKYLVSRGAE